MDVSDPITCSWAWGSLKSVSCRCVWHFACGYLSETDGAQRQSLQRSLQAAVLQHSGASVISVKGRSICVHSIYLGYVSITHTDKVESDSFFFFFQNCLFLVNVPTLARVLPHKLSQTHSMVKLVFSFPPV